MTCAASLNSSNVNISRILSSRLSWHVAMQGQQTHQSRSLCSGCSGRANFSLNFFLRSGPMIAQLQGNNLQPQHSATAARWWLSSHGENAVAVVVILYSPCNGGECAREANSCEAADGHVLVAAAGPCLPRRGWWTSCDRGAALFGSF